MSTLKATEHSNVWNRSEVRVREALGSLVAQISRQRSALRWTVNGSRNDVKPLHIVMTLERSHSANHRLVFSLMFTSWRGPLMRQCDLMIEDGEILARLLDDDL